MRRDKMRRKIGAARGDAATMRGDQDTRACDETIGNVASATNLASGDGTLADSVNEPTSSSAPSDGQQCRAAFGDRVFAQCSAQHFAARRPAALAFGAVYAPATSIARNAIRATPAFRRFRIQPSMLRDRLDKDKQELMDYLYVGVGGLIGSIARYSVGDWLAARLGPAFPYGTFFVNVTGSFVLGLLVGLVGSRDDAQAWRLFLGVGFCGGYTTFSTYALDTVRLIDDGSLVAALGYFVGGPILGLAAALAGIALARAV